MCTIIAELDRDGRLKPEINEEELKESLRCEMLENCTPQFCCTCQQKFSSQLESKAHYDGKPHQKLLQIKLKIMLRKKISEENSRRKLGDSEVINSATIAPEIKQIVTAEMSEVKNSIKEETLKRPGNHLDETFGIRNGTANISLNNENNSRTDYADKPHEKKIKLLEKEQNPSIYTCSLCQVTAITKVHMDIHLQAISIQRMKSGSAPQKENINRLYCDVCDVTGSSEMDFIKHLNGKPHKKKLGFTCNLCQAYCNSQKMLETHLNGKQHKKKLLLKFKCNSQEMLEAHFNGKVHKKKLDLTFKCNLCQFSCNSQEMLETHLNGKAHKYTCYLCQISCDGQESLEAHLIGKPHQKKLNLIEKGQNPVSCNVEEKLATHLQVVSQVSSEEPPENENVVEELENPIAAETNDYISDKESIPMEVAVMMDEKINANSVMIDEKTNDDDDETKDIPDSRDSTMSKPVGHSDTNTESMSMQTAVKMNEITSEKSVIKDEEMDDDEDKDVPGLCDSMSNLAGYSEIIKNNALQIASNQKNELLHPAEFENSSKDVPDLCDSMSNLAGYSDTIKNNELKITLNIKEKELRHPEENEKSPTSKSSEEEEDIVLVTENIEVKKSTKGDDECEEADSSDDDLIILENPDSLSPQKSIQKTPTLNNGPLVESKKLCVYPVGQSESVTVSTQDYATLAYDTFLNDIIIDFYLLYLANNVLSNNDKTKVHIFSTMFYKRLLQSPRADAKKVPEYETDASLTTSEIRHFRVASWTKSVDLFEKDMLIIPICEEFHWYLLLVVKPGVIFLPFEAKERKERGEPFMIVLDSVGGRNNASAKNIRRYLACEWNKKKCAGAELLTNLEQMGKNMQKIRPNKPEQENNSDCGIFLLQYVETVFKNVSAFMWPFLVNMRTKEWFTSQEVAGKRGEIAHLIKRLTEEQKPGEVIGYPNIKFTAKGVDDV